MFKQVKSELKAFDAEWMQDSEADRLLSGLSDEMPNHQVMTEMWQRNGATEDDPQPYLKTVLCRVVSIAMAIRQRNAKGSVTLDLRSHPRDVTKYTDCDKATILKRILTSVEKRSPQLVSYNSSGSDLPIFVQRSIVKGVTAPGFCKWPDKPWERRDYFARNTPWHVDLMTVVGPWGRETPSLSEMATLPGNPGKLGFDGSKAAESWLDGDAERVV